MSKRAVAAAAAARAGGDAEGASLASSRAAYLVSLGLPEVIEGLVRRVLVRRPRTQLAALEELQAGIRESMQDVEGACNCGSHCKEGPQHKDPDLEGAIRLLVRRHGAAAVARAAAGAPDEQGAEPSAMVGEGKQPVTTAPRPAPVTQPVPAEPAPEPALPSASEESVHAAVAEEESGGETAVTALSSSEIRSESHLIAPPAAPPEPEGEVIPSPGSAFVSPDTALAVVACAAAVAVPAVVLQLELLQEEKEKEETRDSSAAACVVFAANLVADMIRAELEHELAQATQKRLAEEAAARRECAREQASFQRTGEVKSGDGDALQN
eukprot:Hpha_TRINITY_DN7821_c0_g1::TRINITY_DN7821_c0_g1_i1::g.185637::m.185637